MGKLSRLLAIALFLNGCSFGKYNKSKDYYINKSVIVMKFNEEIGQTNWCNVEKNSECFYTNKNDSIATKKMLENTAEVIVTVAVVAAVVVLVAASGAQPNFNSGSGGEKKLTEEEIKAAEEKLKIYQPFDQYFALSVSPGKYYLKEFETCKGKSYFGDWNKDTKKASIAEFEVAENEIVYLGDIDVNVLKKKENTDVPKYNINIHDNYEKALNWIQLEYPFLKSDKAVRRLILSNHENSNEEPPIAQVS